jgi:hypothetical protein
MVARENRWTPLPIGKKVLYFALLFVLAAAFFSPARDNSFWHPSDFRLLNHAIDGRGSWQWLFAPTEPQTFQPLVNFLFSIEYSSFGLEAWKYFLFNVLIHSISAFLVFLLVEVLLKDRSIALLSSLLFVFAVGNNGKAVMVVSGISDLLIAMLTLLTLILYFKNELEKGGRFSSRWFAAAAFCFLLSLMTKTTSFGILGCILAFNVFFRSETGKRVLNREFVIIATIALVVLAVKFALGFGFTAEQDFAPSVFKFFKNYASYLTRMVFPIHASVLLDHAGRVVLFIYTLATHIRMLTFLTIVSFTTFGFVFGNRTLRFFIAWTYITVTPFCFLEFPRFTADWLDIRHLYLVSVGFSMILSSVTVLASRMLYQRRWRRLLPYSLPLLFVLLSQFIILQLDTKYELIADLPAIQEMAEETRVRHESAIIKE